MEKHCITISLGVARFWGPKLKSFKNHLKKAKTEEKSSTPILCGTWLERSGAEWSEAKEHTPDIGRYNIIDIISYHCITFSRILIFLYHFLRGDIFVI
jgi:hypothetical protein